MIAIAAAAVGIGAIGARRIETATEFIENLDRRTTLRADYEAINERLAART